MTRAEVQPGRLPTEFSGAWVGTATELDSDSVDSYRVRLELTGGDLGGEVGEIHYEMAASECHGVVTLTGMNPDNAAVTLGEYIESGNCVKGGRIILTAEPDGVLDFAYTGFKRDGTEQSVSASLEKVR
ncbi:hypothetical protein SGFS_077700 [Streptomyces graminofaciens]|uniref:Lipoprotein n=1 Tax=Streptomyces graminofaciens TaxID=68212 RepID=A0ABN5VSM6_9ACTN|nr:hypothetical protein SGFS_077700 [Streptomyces graminofaciens]